MPRPEPCHFGRYSLGVEKKRESRNPPPKNLPTDTHLGVVPADKRTSRVVVRERISSDLPTFLDRYLGLATGVLHANLVCLGFHIILLCLAVR